MSTVKARRLPSFSSYLNMKEVSSGSGVFSFRVLNSSTVENQLFTQAGSHLTKPSRMLVYRSWSTKKSAYTKESDGGKATLVMKGRVKFAG
jgi:hypothetical protein